jgi:hypothetical protein
VERESDTSKKIGATGTISESLRQYLSNIPGKHKIKELQKTAILGTAHILQKMLMCKYLTYFTDKIMLHVSQVVNKEQLQHYLPLKQGWFQVYNCKYPA